MIKQHYWLSFLVVLYSFSACGAPKSVGQVTVDLEIAGVGDTQEQDPGVLVALNDDFDEGTEIAGIPIADNQTGNGSLHSLNGDDDELAKTRLIIKGPAGTVGKWSITNSHPDRLLIWRFDDLLLEWVTIDNNFSSDDLTIDASGSFEIPLLVEGLRTTDTANQVGLTAVFSESGAAVARDVLSASVMDVEIYVNLREPDSGNNDPTDDYLTWAATQCELRVIGINGRSAGIEAVLINDPVTNNVIPGGPPQEWDPRDPVTNAQIVPDNPPRWAGGRVLFANEPAGQWPPNTTATETSLSFTGAQALPADDTVFTRFRMAGQFGRPSYKDKDAIVSVRLENVDGRSIGNHRLMVRVRKNANRLHDFEIKLFLDAMRAYQESTTLQSFGNRAIVHSAGITANDEAHSSELPQPSFHTWHRAFLLQVEREIQQLQDGRFRAVTPTILELGFSS